MSKLSLLRIIREAKVDDALGADVNVMPWRISIKKMWPLLRDNYNIEVQKESTAMTVKILKSIKKEIGNINVQILIQKKINQLELNLKPEKM